jgi:hypothetical protein
VNIIANRSIVNDRALIPEAQEHVPATETIRALRAALNTLGDGFVEAIDDSTLMAIAQNQIERSEGRIHGEAVEVPVLEAPGVTRIGRFGWKDQHSSLLSFIGDAYLNEMGVTNRFRPRDVTTIGKSTADPEDTPDNLGLADIDHFAQFIRGTKVPPRDAALAGTPASSAGEKLFDKIGCTTCHVSTIITAPAGTPINGGAFAVPDALGNKIIRAPERCRHEYAIPGTDDLDLHQLYRAMAWLEEPLPKAQQTGATPFAPRTTKDLIEEALFARRRDLFSSLDLVFFDTTSLYFHGAGGTTLGRHGHSRDYRPDLKQMPRTGVVIP